MSKAEAFSNFRPSFISVGLGWIPKLFEKAFADGRLKVADQIGAADSYQGMGAVGAGWDRSIRFGHVRRTDPIGEDLSGAAAYRLQVDFDGDAIREVKLTLNLLNPRVVIADDFFLPANFLDPAGGEPSIEVLTDEPEPCGFAILYEPDTLSPAERFEKLRKDIHDAVLATTQPAGYLPFDQDTLVGRLDVSISWKSDTLGKISTDVFGYAIGTPSADLPDGLSVARLFSPAVKETFDTLVNRTVGFALELPRHIIDGIVVASGKYEGMSANGAKLYASAKREFNLTDNFAGILFEGLHIHVLDDSGQPLGNYVHGGVGLTAFAIDGKEEKLGNWYTTFEAEMDAAPGKHFLHIFSHFSISAMLADRDIKQFQLKTRFDGLDAPFTWLNGRDAVVSLGLDQWKDRLGNDQKGRSIGLSLESATPGDVIALLNPETLGLSPELFRTLATSMTLAPIVLLDTPEAAEHDNSATETKRQSSRLKRTNPLLRPR